MSFSDPFFDDQSDQSRELGSTVVFRPPSSAAATLRPEPLSNESSLDRTLELGTLIGERYECVKHLGKGGFGTVYLARDLRLERLVALKLVRDRRGEKPAAEQSRLEAAAIAALNHPNIVSVFDLVEWQDGVTLIVMEYLDGKPLSKCFENLLVSPIKSVDLIIQVTAAIQHVHERGLIHSDLKPSNIYLLPGGTVKLLDFGLVIALIGSRRPPHLGGTVGYMAPEQLRGESHLIDERIDIWAIGVVLYQLLAGHPPFRGGDQGRLIRSTLHDEPPPLRTVAKECDGELQRIVHKCLAKQRSERYESAAALLDDLRYWRSRQVAPDGDLLDVAASNDDLPNSSTRSSSQRIKRHGLLPFVASDASLYRTLIPGPRDRYGVPDSVRFWLHWIRSDDAVTDHPVGVLYGPIGAGKTSYVRAGLLPMLEASHRAVYIACRPGDLAERIVRTIENALFELPSRSSLLEALKQLRNSGSSQRGFRKLLIVLDQFDAWSRSATREQMLDLADALRQCDGQQIRALIVTRDEQWVTLQTLMQWLEIPMQEGRNMAAIDLLEPSQARDILEGIGRDDGLLPPRGEELSKDQTAFLDTAVADLAIQGKIICLHLVIFAQIMRLQQWTAKNLQRCGGVVGACSLFFDELFDKRNLQQRPQYRRVADLAVVVLDRLLPREDKSVEEAAATGIELSQLAAAANLSHLLDDCLQLLVEELKIVTVTTAGRIDQSSGELVVDSSDQADVPESDVAYRLSHDFLIAPLQHWLDRVQSGSWRGRTKARLQELSDLWSRRESPSYLPRFGEFLVLLGRAQFTQRSEKESRYLRASLRHHAGRVTALSAALLALVVMTAALWWQWSEASAARSQALASYIDMLMTGPAEDYFHNAQQLTAIGGRGIAEVKYRIDTANPAARFRARLFLAERQVIPFEQVVSLLEYAEPLFFDALLSAARNDAGSFDALNAQSTPPPPPPPVREPSADPAIRNAGTIDAAATELWRRQLTRASRAAILAFYLDRPQPLFTLLSGTDNAEIDHAVVLEAIGFRGPPDRLVAALNDANLAAEVRYHLGVILGGIPRDEIARAQSQIDLETLWNRDAVELHSIGRFLARHLGAVDAVPPPAPPAGADWKVGPGGLIMTRFASNTLNYEPPMQVSKYKWSGVVERDFWISVTPVPYEMYDQCVAAGVTRPDGKPLETLAPERRGGDSESRRGDQPVRGLQQTDAIVFCNWLSEREGLRPAYKYTPDIKPTEHQVKYNLPPVPWTVDAGADGFRLPTPEQYVCASLADYKFGFPWLVAKAVGRSGGDYADPSAGDFARPLYSLIPNRRGVYATDMKLGSFIGGHETRTASQLGREGYIDYFIRNSFGALLSFHLVQQPGQ